MINLLKYGDFVSHSGVNLSWKIDCDAFNDDDIQTLSQIIKRKFVFNEVHGIPRGGLRLAEALKVKSFIGNTVLIVDDVLTTGSSMLKAKADVLRKNPGAKVRGVVIFNRSQILPSWIWPIFNVAPWTEA